jgi:hypothetical protein
MVLQLLGPTRPAGNPPDETDPGVGVVLDVPDEPGELVHPEISRIATQIRRIQYGDFRQGLIREIGREVFKMFV